MSIRPRRPAGYAQNVNIKILAAKENLLASGNMTTINDAMYTALKAIHPEAGETPTLGDLLYLENLSPRLGSYEYYAAAAPGSTWSDVALAYWSDPDYAASNLEAEDGTDLLLEDGSFILLEAGNG